MLVKNVLVPFDESHHARAALHMAMDIVGDDPAATIHVIMVVSSDIMPPSMLSAPNAFGDTFMDYQNYDAMLTSIAKRTNQELHDSVAGILGKDAEALAAKLIVEAQLAPAGPAPSRMYPRLGPSPASPRTEPHAPRTRVDGQTGTRSRRRPSNQLVKMPPQANGPAGASSCISNDAAA